MKWVSTEPGRKTSSAMKSRRFEDRLDFRDEKGIREDEQSSFTLRPIFGFDVLN